ncbi:MAG: hypothetical protein JW829_08340 [Pirellulales bacterium]|nr:hypothetical protein [Pirellulales bacterium]
MRHHVFLAPLRECLRVLRLDGIWRNPSAVVKARTIHDNDSQWGFQMAQTCHLNSGFY